LSGLFVRRCTNCGLELKLGVLHALVVVAFYLAHRGMPGETLFGALALLVCLLRLGADAGLKVVMPVDQILGEVEPVRCCHKLMDASELMKTVPHEIIDKWSEDCRTGWMCILQVLLLRERGRNVDPDSGLGSDSCDLGPCDLGTRDFAEDFPAHWVEGAEYQWLHLPCGNPQLGLLWATIQVELLTYRRIKTSDPWLSSRFSMRALRDWLEKRSPSFCTSLVDGGLIRPHSPCGWFGSSEDFLIPTAEEVCEKYFMNMDVYDRASFTHRPYLCDEWIDISAAE
jgi:hypothetical protein